VLLAICELPRLHTLASSRRSGSASLPMTRVPSGGASWWFRRTNHYGSVRRTPRRDVGPTTSKSTASSSSRHSRSRSNRPAHSKLPTIQEEVNQPRRNTATDGDLRTNLDWYKRGCSTRSYIDQRHRGCKERELRCRLDYDREYGGGGGPRPRGGGGGGGGGGCRPSHHVV
jgi:hypothetical protein